MATVFVEEQDDSEYHQLEVPPVHALPVLGLENELRRVDSVELVFHSVLTTTTGDGRVPDRRGDHPRNGEQPPPDPGESCLWHFIIQTATNSQKSKKIVNGTRASVILATAVLNVDARDGICAIFRGSDQRPLNVYFHFPSIAVGNNDSWPVGETFCHWQRLDGDLAATANLNTRSFSGMVEGTRGQTFGRLLSSSGRNRSSGSQRRRPFACGQADVRSVHAFESGMRRVAEVTHNQFEERLNSTMAYAEANETVDKVLYRIDFEKDSSTNARSLCLGLVMTLGCYDAMLYFNPKSPAKSKSSRLGKSKPTEPTTTL